MSRSYGNNIRARRKQLGMNQQKLAEAVGFKNKSSISEIENGKKPCFVEDFVKIANALQISPGSLLDGNFEMVVVSRNVSLDINEANFISDLRNCAPNIRSAAMKMVRDSAKENEPETKDAATESA